MSKVKNAKPAKKRVESHTILVCILISVLLFVGIFTFFIPIKTDTTAYGDPVDSAWCTSGPRSITDTSRYPVLPQPHGTQFYIHKGEYGQYQEAVNHLRQYAPEEIYCNFDMPIYRLYL